MMAAKGAVKPVYELMADAGEKFDPNAYLPAVTGYYTTPDGKMLSLPLNSSTPVFYYNKDAFKKAGLDPAKPPADVARDGGDGEEDPGRRATPAASPPSGSSGSCSRTTPPGTTCRSPRKAERVRRARHRAPAQHPAPRPTHRPARPSGRRRSSSTTAAGAATPSRSSPPGSAGCSWAPRPPTRHFKATKGKFEFGIGMMPYWPDVAGAPQNSIIGGATLWVLAGHKPEEYKGVAKFFSYLSLARGPGRLPPADRLPPDHPGRLRADQEAGVLREEPRDRHLDPPDEQQASHARTPRGSAWATSVQIRDVMDEETGGGLGRQEAAQGGPGRARSSAGTTSCGSSSGPTSRPAVSRGGGRPRRPRRAAPRPGGPRPCTSASCSGTGSCRTSWSRPSWSSPWSSSSGRPARRWSSPSSSRTPSGCRPGSCGWRTSGGCSATPTTSSVAGHRGLQQPRPRPWLARAGASSSP